MRVIGAQTRYRPVGSFKGYLYRIAHNVLVDHYRRRGRDPEPTDPMTLHPEDPAERPDAAYDRAATRAQITSALAELPPEQREAFLLHREGGLTVQEIGQVVGANRETVKSRLRYANQRLRKALRTHAPVSEQRA